MLITCFLFVHNECIYLSAFMRLRLQAFPKHELDIVYSAILVNRITYALPAWAGYLIADLINRVNSLLKKYFKYGYSKKCDTLSQLLQHADNKLFAWHKPWHKLTVLCWRALKTPINQSTKPTHCAHYLLPPFKPYVRTLRTRGHNYALPKCKYSQYKNSFVCRHVYSNTKTQMIRC